MAVKLIASDLDGTLLRNDKSISEETGKALEKAREAGIYFVPSTGRARGSDGTSGSGICDHFQWRCRVFGFRRDQDL